MSDEEINQLMAEITSISPGEVLPEHLRITTEDAIRVREVIHSDTFPEEIVIKLMASLNNYRDLARNWNMVKDTSDLYYQRCLSLEYENSRLAYENIVLRGGRNE